MNTWHMLATVYTYPRVIDKAKTLIRIKANNVRTNFTADRRAQKLTREIPVYAQAGTAAALLQNLKTTSFVLL
ncbi:MAG: hypothetical protein GY930_02835, partial [bacterium]|nr:hypothetical protein [bacterium]